MVYFCPGYGSVSWWRNQRIKKWDRSPFLPASLGGETSENVESTGQDVDARLGDELFDDVSLLSLPWRLRWRCCGSLKRDARSSLVVTETKFVNDGLATIIFFFFLKRPMAAVWHFLLTQRSNPLNAASWFLGVFSFSFLSFPRFVCCYFTS